MSITSNLLKVLEGLGNGAKLIAISKTYPPEALMEAYNAGQRAFGENKVQELVPKYEQLPKDIEWHMVGHLQSNKVKYIAPFVSYIHSVDSLNILSEINKQASKNNRKIKCMVQVHVAKEETKFGFDLAEAEDFFQKYNPAQFPNIILAGVMGMATNTDNEALIRSEFKQIKSFFDKIKRTYPAISDEFCEISMGMSSDYTIAMEEGSTFVRVGSSIFGKRFYL